MASESALRGAFGKEVRKRGGFVEQVENGINTGTPDTFARLGGWDMWLELKHLRAWPKRARTVVRIDHYTVDQKMWLWNYAQAGGSAWLLLQVGREYLLFSCPAFMAVGDLVQADLREVADVVCSSVREVVGYLEDVRNEL